MVHVRPRVVQVLSTVLICLKLRMPKMPVIRHYSQSLRLYLIRSPLWVRKSGQLQCLPTSLYRPPHSTCQVNRSPITDYSLKDDEKNVCFQSKPRMARVAHIHISWLQGSSINDVTALGGRGCHEFCDNSTKALVMKFVTKRGGGVNNNPNLRKVIYGRPHRGSNIEYRCSKYMQRLIPVLAGCLKAEGLPRCLQRLTC